VCVCCSAKKSYLIAADSKESMQNWLDSLRHVKDQLISAGKIACTESTADFRKLSVTQDTTTTLSESQYGTVAHSSTTLTGSTAAEEQSVADNGDLEEMIDQEGEEAEEDVGESTV
jgi:hypothetical protein